MHKLIFTVALAYALGPSLSQAQVKLDVTKITCGEALAMPADDKADLAAFMSGYFAQKSGRTYIDIGLFQKNTASVMDWCSSNKSESLFAGLQRAFEKK